MGSRGAIFCAIWALVLGSVEVQTRGLTVSGLGPAGQAGAGRRVAAMWRTRAASGQAAAKAMRTR